MNAKGFYALGAMVGGVLMMMRGAVEVGAWFVLIGSFGVAVFWRFTPAALAGCAAAVRLFYTATGDAFGTAGLALLLFAGVMVWSFRDRIREMVKEPVELVPVPVTYVVETTSAAVEEAPAEEIEQDEDEATAPVEEEPDAEEEQEEEPEEDEEEEVDWSALKGEDEAFAGINFESAIRAAKNRLSVLYARKDKVLYVNADNLEKFKAGKQWRGLMWDIDQAEQWLNNLERAYGE